MNDLDKIRRVKAEIFYEENDLLGVKVEDQYGWEWILDNDEFVRNVYIGDESNTGAPTNKFKLVIRFSEK